MPSHWGHRGLNIVSQSSPTGTQALHAIGTAEAGRFYERISAIPERATKFHADEVVYMSVGDGTTSEGEFWESLNSACNLLLPVVYLVEDNGYAISVPVEVNTPGGDISKLVASFPGLFVQSIDGTDFLASYAAMRQAIDYARARKGPAFVHAKVTRPYSHSLSDDEKLYKTPDERAAEATRDPITRLASFLVAEDLASESELKAIVREVEEAVNAAAEIAKAAEKPSRETVSLYVYSPDIDPTSAAFDTEPTTEGKPDTMVAAINRTLKDEMARDPRIVVFGEDVADCSRETALDQVSGKGGVFKVTHGLQRAFGGTRVFNSPLAEANIIGRAVGMAVRGIKPVVEIQFFDYIWPAMMQMRDEMSMMRYRSNNQWSCPMVIRTAIGGYLRGGAPYHSQSGESIFAHCPGIRVVFPSNARDAAGLLRTAIRCQDPVLYLEHKHLYRQTYNKGEYPGRDYMIPFGKAAVRREGTDVTVLAWGALVQRTLLAAQLAEKDGISVQVLDLRTIMPFDWHGITAAVKKTNRVVIAHEDQLTCGFGAELAARIADELFAHLDAPVRRVAALDTPVAYYPDLEEEILPQSADVLKAIRELARY
jgi:2-oxoisovalerate dehydrogenase E1 component